MTTYDHPPWNEGWQESIRAATRELGYANFLDFMKAYVGEPYGKVLRVLRSQLKHMVPMMQLHKMHMFEAIDAGRSRDAAKDSLVRALREHVPRGWNKGKGAREGRARAFAYWVLPCRGSEDLDRVTKLCDRIWEELEAINPSADWCPFSPDDPVLGAAFARGWPERPESENSTPDC